MTQFVQTHVDEQPARQLLEEYFAFRAGSFPRPGGYHVALPDPTVFTRPHGIFLVATAGDVALGCGGIRMLEPNRAEVKHLWVRPSARGQRLGQGLLAELERLAAELGAIEVVLDTNSSLTEAGRLYRSAGYLSIEPYNDNPNANVWLGKALGPTKNP